MSDRTKPAPDQPHAPANPGDWMIEATRLAATMGQAVIEAEAAVLAGVGLAGAAAVHAPESDAEKARHEAEVEEGFDNMPV